MNCNKKEKESLPASKAFDIAALVDIAEGAIVSRTLTENDAGTLTVFAFAEGQGLSEHSAPFDAIVQVLFGEAEFTIGGSPVTVKAGQILKMPADIPHAVKAISPFKMLLIMLRAGETRERDCDCG